MKPYGQTRSSRCEIIMSTSPRLVLDSVDKNLDPFRGQRVAAFERMIRVQRALLQSVP